MSDSHTHRLDGCTPTPLANYLKALGVLRLISSPENNVKGKAADHAARGWWANERFHLKTRLDRDALLRFFLEDYAPSPIIAPWNGRAGFLEGDDAEESTREGAELMRQIERTSSPRLSSFKSAIQSLRRDPILGEYNELRAKAKAASKEEKESTGSGKLVAMERRKLLTKLAERIKSELLPSIRATADVHQVAFLDACFVLSQEPRTAPLLGSGGLDGSRDFGVNFARALSRIFSIQTGEPEDGADIGLAVAMFGTSLSLGLKQTGTMGQFGPGQGGPNASTGFDGANPLNQWDIILALEGSLFWSGTLTRRWGLGSSGRAAFPFTFDASRAGSGALSTDDPNTPRGEIWTPLWAKPSNLIELAALLAEGRLTVGRVTARTGLDAARAVARLGVSRGLTAFERYSLIQPDAKMPYQATPLGRFIAPKQPRKDPVADLDHGGWLGRLRRSLGENAPARARIAVRRLDDALFEIAREGAQAESLQRALMALGEVVSWLTTSREGRGEVSPPPRLGRQWTHGADDGSAEFRVAAALASLGWPDEPLRKEEPEAEDETEPESATNDGAEAERAEGDAPRSAADSVRQTTPPPMAAHLAPVEEPTVARRFRHWIDKNKDSVTVVWGAGSLVQNMIAVLERRLIEQAVRGLSDKPLEGPTTADLPAIAAFLEGPPLFDDARCAALLAGLVWAQPARLAPRSSENARTIPFAYAALKPLFTPDAQLRATSQSKPGRRQHLSAERALPIPPGLLARLRRGALDEALREALGSARASGIASPFNPVGNAARSMALGRAVKPDRLAAALLIPIDEFALTSLMKRAYPLDERQEETDDAA